MKYSTAKILLYVVLIIWSLTILRSITIMIGGKKIFQKASRGDKSCYAPILNLFSMLEIVDISTYAGIMFFIPGINVLILTAMSYKLGSVFKTGFFFKILLVLCPIIFYPVLGASKRVYKVKDVSFFKAETEQRAENKNLMTPDPVKEPKNDEAVEENNVKVDSIFKGKVEVMEQVAPYKAAKIDIYGMDKLKNKGNENTSIESDKPKESDNNIETIDL